MTEWHEFTGWDAQRWEYLAEIWEGLEHLGMDGPSMTRFSAHIASPVLVVGAAQGLLVEGLLALGHQVCGVDASRRMVERARRRRGLLLTLGRAEELPYPSGLFGTAVVATAVLKPRPTVQARLCLEEVKRVLCSGARIVLGLASLDESLQSAASQVGYVCGYTQQHARVVELWRAANDQARLEAMIARWTGCSPPEARSRVQRHARLIASVVGSVQAVTLAFRRRGVDPEPILDSCELFRHELWSRANIDELLRRCNLAPLQRERTSRDTEAVVASPAAHTADRGTGELAE